MIRLALVLLTGFALGVFLTGNLFGVFYPLLFFDHLPLALWLVGLGAGVLGGWIAWRLLRRRLKPLVLPAVLTTAAIVTGVVGMAATAGVWRGIVISRFAPDNVQSRSFLASLRSAPRDYQFDLHSAMVRQCTAYGWSYRTMAPYEIPARAIANVMPRDWFADGTRCGQTWQKALD